MVSTPSRSRAVTRMSLPCMVGPTSARSCVPGGLVSVVVLFMVGPAVFGANRGQTKKNHDRCQPWVPVQMALSATSPGGVVCNDDERLRHLLRNPIHLRQGYPVGLDRVKRRIQNQNAWHTWHTDRDTTRSDQRRGLLTRHGEAFSIWGETERRKTVDTCPCVK